MAELILGRAQQEASPEGATEELRTIAEAALRTYAEDDELCLMAHAALSDVASMRADSISAVREMRAAAVHARRAERSGWAEMLELAGTGLMIEGPLPLEECMAAASRRWRTATARVDQAVGAAHTGAIAAMVGDLGLQREAFAFADELATEMKLPVFLGISRWYATSVLGHWSAAAAAVEDAIRDLRRGGHLSQLSTQAAVLAVLRLHLGEVPAARAALEGALETTSSDDVLTLALAAGAKGWLAALDGDPPTARSEMQRACAGLEQDLLTRAFLHVSCAEVESLLGDPVAAAEHQRHAVELYRRKGATAAVAHLEEIMAAAPG